VTLVAIAPRNAARDQIAYLRPAIVGAVLLRPAAERDVPGIVGLINGYAASAVMLFRTEESVRLTLADFVVAVDAHDTVVACGALKEYSPSLAEVASVAVARNAQGRGLGAAIVTAVEQLARKRDVDELFALTLTAPFFERVGYAVTDRARYPEKIRRDCLACPRRIRCGEVCVAKVVRAEIAAAA
jgi:amino-acid N-acetyltransferase